MKKEKGESMAAMVTAVEKAFEITKKIVSLEYFLPFLSAVTVCDFLLNGVAGESLSVHPWANPIRTILTASYVVVGGFTLIAAAWFLHILVKRHAMYLVERSDPEILDKISISLHAAECLVQENMEREKWMERLQARIEDQKHAGNACIREGNLTFSGMLFFCACWVTPYFHGSTVLGDLIEGNGRGAAMLACTLLGFLLFIWHDNLKSELQLEECHDRRAVKEFRELRQDGWHPR